MNQNLIFWPMIVQALVTIWMFIPMSRARFAAVKFGTAQAHDFKLPKQKEPEAVAKFGNAVSNQFEIPVLFFAVCIAAHSAAQVDLPLLVLAWGFVISKSAHSYVHMTSNKLKHRFRLFVAALAFVLLLWVWFAIKLALT